jgi:hypothetical protein
MPGEGFGKDVMTIALMFGGIAIWALVIGHATQVTSIIKTTGDTFSGLLGIVTLQSGYQNAFTG